LEFRAYHTEPWSSHWGDSWSEEILALATRSGWIREDLVEAVLGQPSWCKGRCVARLEDFTGEMGDSWPANFLSRFLNIVFFLTRWDFGVFPTPIFS